MQCPECGQRLPWTRERISEALREWHSQYGDVPTATELVGGSEHWPSMDAVTRQFGTLSNALRSSGLTPRRQGQTKRMWTRGEVIDAIRDWVATHEDIPTITAWRGREGVPPLTTIQRLFGSWNNAIIAAGFDPRPRGRQRSTRAFLPNHLTKNRSRSYVPRT